MASLFNTLLRLQSRQADRTPLEDYFTELLAYLLRDEPAVLVGLLQRFNLTKLTGPTTASLTTQVTFGRLPGHDRDSRPDMVVTVRQANSSELILLESKIGSTEQPQQLRRYAEQLAAQEGLAARTLVYVTRDYDPKNPAELLTELAADVRFVQLRWYEVYYWLKKNFKTSWLAGEVCRFMEKNRMEQALQFNPVDLVALTNFRQAKAMMDESLLGAVLDKFRQFGGTGMKLSEAMTQFERHGRYIIINWQLAGLWAGIGYFMATDDPFAYPEIGLMLEINTHAGGQPQQVVEAMREVVAAHPHEWRGHKLEMTRQWVSISRRQPLHEFLQGSDHQQQVRAYLLDCLEALAGIRGRYPDLPWVSRPSHPEGNEVHRPGL